MKTSHFFNLGNSNKKIYITHKYFFPTQFLFSSNCPLYDFCFFSLSLLQSHHLYYIYYFIILLNVPRKILEEGLLNLGQLSP